MSATRIHSLLSADYVPGLRKRRPVRWGAITLLLTAIVVVLGISHWSPFSRYSMTVQADFDPALHIYPHTPVRVNGYDVGSVTAARLLPDQAVRLTMSITDRALKLHGDASAQISYRTLLGRNVYVALDPGRADGSTLTGPIPTSRTGAQVEVDQALSFLQPRARSGVQHTFAELGKGLDAGPSVGETLTRAPSALNDTSSAVTAIRGQNPGYDLPRLITGANSAVTALNADESALAGVVDNANTSLAVTAARSAAVDSTLVAAPATLEQTELTMLRLRRTLAKLDPLAENLEPGVQRISASVTAAVPTLGEVTRIVPTAIPTLRRLQPALVSLKTLGSDGVPLLDKLTPTVDRIDSSILPWLSETSPVTKLKNYESIGPTFATVASSASDYDSGGYMQRFQPGLKSGTDQLPVAESQCASLLSSIPDAGQGCQELFGDINTVLGDTAATPTGARR